MNDTPMPDDERRELAEQVVNMARNNAESRRTLEGRGFEASPLDVLAARLDLFLTLALGPGPTEPTIETVLGLPEGRLIFEAEWQAKLARLNATALRATAGSTGGIVKPKGGKLILPK